MLYEIGVVFIKLRRFDDSEGGLLPAPRKPRTIPIVPEEELEMPAKTPESDSKYQNRPSLPLITPLQFLVLSLLTKCDELAGRNLRTLLLENGVKSSGPRFYQMMSRLEESGYVTGWYAQKEIEHQVVNERRYRIVAGGRDVWQKTCDFYSSCARVAGDGHQQLHKRSKKGQRKMMVRSS